MVKIRVRAVIGVMIFLGYFLTYVVRYNLSVHIVEMAQVLTRDKLQYNITNIHRTSVLNRLYDSNTWDDKEMAKLFSAYHIGYCVCFPIFHSLGDRLGPTWIVGIAGVISGSLNCLTPSSAYINFWMFFIVRITTGFCAGAMQPSMIQVLRYWVPPIERHYFMWAYCGITMGTFSTFLLCAMIHYYSKWPVGFYIVGVLQMAWAMLWTYIVTDSPSTHQFISQEERDYLLNTIGTIFTIKTTNSRAPWKLILKSWPFWALCILNFGYAWMITALCLHGPLYYSGVVEYSMYEAAALTSLPFFLRLLLGTVVIQIFHWYKYKISDLNKVKRIRKYFTVFSHVIPGLIVMVSWLSPVVPGPYLLTVAVAFTAAGMEMTLDHCYDLTPTFVSSIYTVIKIMGNVAGIIVSLGVGQVTHTYKNTPTVWKHIWCFHATVLFLSGIIFLIWGETTVQPWSLRTIRPPRRHYNCNHTTSMMSNIPEAEEDSKHNINLTNTTCPTDE